MGPRRKLYFKTQLQFESAMYVHFVYMLFSRSGIRDISVERNNVLGFYSSTCQHSYCRTKLCFPTESRPDAMSLALVKEQNIRLRKLAFFQPATTMKGNSDRTSTSETTIMIYSWPHIWEMKVQISALTWSLWGNLWQVTPWQVQV